MATTVGFHFEVRELGTSNWRHYDVAPGELCVVGAGGAASELCWQSHGHGRAFEVVELYIDPEGLRSKSGHPDLASVDPCWRVQQDQLLTQLLGSIARELDTPESAEDSFGELATTLLGVHLERAYGARRTAPQELRHGGLSPFVLQRVREYVAAHLARPIRLQRLATLAGLSPFHFCRAFKVSTGLSPHAFLLHCRVAEAKRLLSGTTLALADIARRTGFTSPGQFSTRFHASTGVTPSTFRRLSRP
jgi:AraC family transcriptional regulator